MHFEYDRNKLVEVDIKYGTSDELSALIEILEEDIEDALHTPPAELARDPFLLYGDTDDENEALDEGRLFAGHDEAMKLYRYLVGLHERATEALIAREAFEEECRCLRAEQINDYSDRCCPQPIYYL